MGVATEPVLDEPSISDGGLGPSVTAEFTEALPLEELVKAKSTPRVKAQEPVPPTALPAEVFSDSIRQVDTTLSALFNVEPEEARELDPITSGLYPLAQYYASQQASVTTLWMIAGMAFLSYASLKYVKIREPVEEAVTDDKEDERH